MAAPSSSAMAATSSAASLHTTPPPAKIAGRCAESKILAALSMRLRSPRALVWPERYALGGSMSSSISAPGSRSLGMSSSTGPILPEVATRKAWRNASGSSVSAPTSRVALLGLDPGRLGSQA